MIIIFLEFTIQSTHKLFIPTISKPTSIKEYSFFLTDNIFLNKPFIYKSGTLNFD